MIKRGPNPEGNFQILPNATSRDRRLSFRARGLLALMLSYPENWTFNRDWLARQSEQDGVSAVRSALKELEDAGYLVRRRIRVDGRFAWEQILYRTAQRQGTPGESIGGKPADETPADGEAPSKEDGDEHGYEDELILPPPSQAQAGAINEEPDLDDELSWRQQDRLLFAEIIDGLLRSDGRGRWAKGTWQTNAFYAGFRKRGKKWPGRWLERITSDGGLEDWLLDEGLEIVSGAY